VAHAVQDHPDIHKHVHPPIVALFYMVFAFALGFLIPIPLPMPPLVKNLGFALLCIGFLFGLAAIMEFRKARTTLDPHGSVTQVISSGIYRLSRNPIYLGFLLIVIGLPLCLGLYGGIILAPFFIFTMNRLVIEHEEAYLEKKFGAAYAGYRSRVRRWL
jgi:protein-S-isoprenylcysteine O-methyltransferase Ste14